ncbi:MAG: aromatic ring-hydroxylating oxygenase subunit alpha [Acidimicrobiales bacterium]
MTRVVGDVAAGRFPAGIYSDPDIFALEKRRLFCRTWQYLAHESEVPEPGDYVVRRILNDSFIVARGEDGQVRAMLNMCRHRGMQVCRAEAGNTSHFRCPYHAWTYRNDGQLIGVTFFQEAYEGDRGLNRAEHGLLPPPQTASYRGMIFACLDPSTPSLEESLGGFRFFLDLYLNQSEDGAEVRGPQRWIVHSNWKIGAENFAGDSYHTPYTHASVVDVGLFDEPTAHRRKLGALYWADGGGGTTYKLPGRDFDENLAYVGYPTEMIDRMRARWDPSQRALVADAGFIVSAATVFPNLSLVHNWPIVAAGGSKVPFISIRLWQPLGPTDTEVSSWFAVDRQAPPWYKEQSYKAYLTCFGSSGMLEQDDVENWTSITEVAKGHFASRVTLDSTMGLDPAGGTLRDPVAGWPGPGRAFTGYGEYNQRELLRRWGTYLLDQLDPPSAAPAPAGVAENGIR